MSNEDVVVLILFLAAAVVVHGAVVVPLVRWWRKMSDSNLVLDVVRANISFQWKFYEEIEEGLFTSDSPDLQAALSRLLNGHTEKREMRTQLVMSCVAHLERFGEATTREINYSRRGLREHPYTFQFLPDWRRKECEEYLIRVAKHRDEDTVFLGGAIQLSGGGKISFAAPIEAGDLGLTLYQLKKPAQGNQKDPEDEEQSPDLRLVHA